jgi:hypothetical protein
MNRRQHFIFIYNKRASTQLLPKRDIKPHLARQRIQWVSQAGYSNNEAETPPISAVLPLIGPLAHPGCATRNPALYDPNLKGPNSPQDFHADNKTFHPTPKENLTSITLLPLVPSAITPPSQPAPRRSTNQNRQNGRNRHSDPPHNPLQLPRRIRLVRVSNLPVFAVGRGARQEEHGEGADYFYKGWDEGQRQGC